MLVNLLSLLGELRGWGGGADPLLGSVSSDCGQPMNPPSETREGVTVNKQSGVSWALRRGRILSCDSLVTDQGGKEEPVRASQSRERRDSHVSYTAPPDCASNTAG